MQQHDKIGADAARCAGDRSSAGTRAVSQHTNQQAHPRARLPDAPEVSIIIATCGRVDGLAAALAGFEECPGVELSWELLIVFNACRQTIVDDFRSLPIAQRLPVRTFHLSQAGKSRALNKAIEQARGRLLVFTDDDVEYGPDWLAELWRAYCRWGDQAVYGGRILPAFPGNAPAWIKNPEIVPQTQAFTRYDFGQQERRVGNAPFGPNMAASKALIDNHRFDTRLGPGSRLGVVMGDETDFGERLKAAGADFVYVPAAEVRHVVRPEQLEPDWLFARARVYGRAKAIKKMTTPSGDLVGSRAVSRQLNKSRKKLISAWLRVLFSLGLSPRWRFRLRWRQELRKGLIEGLRLARDAQ